MGRQRSVRKALKVIRRRQHARIYNVQIHIPQGVQSFPDKGKTHHAGDAVKEQRRRVFRQLEIGQRIELLGGEGPGQRVGGYAATGQALQRQCVSATHEVKGTHAFQKKVQHVLAQRIPKNTGHPRHARCFRQGVELSGICGAVKGVQIPCAGAVIQAGFHQQIVGPGQAQHGLPVGRRQLVTGVMPGKTVMHARTGNHGHAS